MINITIYGLDQFVVQQISKEITSNLAKLCETSEENINFISPNNMVFHNGYEQTSWHVIINFNAPEQLKALEDKIYDFIINSIKLYAINIEINFTYYHLHSRHLYINDDYPRYLDEENSKEIDIDYEEIDEEEEIFTGDIFKDYKDHFHNN